MALTGVEAVSTDDAERAADLAAHFGVPVVTALARRADGVRLVVDGATLSLGFEDRARGKPFSIAWDELARRPALPRSHIFRRALGSGRVVVDATAGFGQDTVRALGLGFEVTAVERDPVVHALLENAVTRGRADVRLAEWLPRLTLKHADAAEYLGAHSADVVYLDPMFSKLKSTAKSPKEMQLLQDLLGPAEPADDARLFAAARACARGRVVVKRALKARVEGPPPSHSFKGQSVRYDVYPRG